MGRPSTFPTWIIRDFFRDEQVATFASRHEAVEFAASLNEVRPHFAAEKAWVSEPDADVGEGDLASVPNEVAAMAAAGGRS